MDTWKDTHPYQNEYTWCNKSLSSQSQIDYWLISKDLSNVAADILPSPLSDHKSICIFIPVVSSPLSHKPAYWKLNSSILKHSAVCSEIRKYWSKAINENSFGLDWELLKYEIAKFLRKYCSDLAKMRKEEEQEVISKIFDLNESENFQLVVQQHRLVEIYKRRAEGAFVRSCRQWLEEGEQNSAYVFRLERHQSRNNSIQYLKMYGSITDEPKKNSNILTPFLKEVYMESINKGSLPRQTHFLCGLRS